jgi:4-hydroxy 2-oxovalerate aldolase
MDRLNLLDCTLRDGGYIVNWEFSECSMKEMIEGLIAAHLDCVEVGYLNNRPYVPNTSIFNNIVQISDLLPGNRDGVMILAMADVTQFFPEDITPNTNCSIDGIRVVFYKHQTEAAMKLCKAVRENGYRLLVQPMVTIDYSQEEYRKLMKDISLIDPYAVSIVDSFGYMSKEDFREYFKILDEVLPQEVSIGFHSHNNMQMAFITAQDVLEYRTERRLIIDSSLYGMGRGAGNLHTELIANYYNKAIREKYDIIKILDLISTYIMPIKKTKSWGYSPYFFLTGLYRCHPNFAAFLLEEEEVSVSEFKAFIETIPDEMRTKCRREYVRELFQKFKDRKRRGGR